jgi:ligand-binding sensor domain-containing protein
LESSEKRHYIMRLLKYLLFLLIVAPLLLTNSCKQDLGTAVKPGPKWKTFTTATSPLLSDSVYAVGVDAQEVVWFGTDKGASTLRNTGWNSYVDELAFNLFGQTDTTVHHAVNSIAFGIDGSTWFGLAGGGVRRYLPTSSNAQWTSYTTNDNPPSIGTDNVIQLATDNFGPGGSSEVWVVSSFGGAARFLPRTGQPGVGDWKIFTTSDGLPTVNCTSVQINFVQRTSWFGSGYGDLASYDNGLQWIQTRLPNGYTGAVQCLAFEKSGIVWAGTIDGADRRSVGWTTYTAADGLAANNVHAIAIDPKGIKWIGTDAGLTRFDNTTFSTFDHTNSPLPDDHVNSLAVDLDGRIWIGTNGGAAVYDPNGK